MKGSVFLGKGIMGILSIFVLNKTDHLLPDNYSLFILNYSLFVPSADGRNKINPTGFIRL